MDDTKNRKTYRRRVFDFAEACPSAGSSPILRSSRDPSTSSGQVLSDVVYTVEHPQNDKCDGDDSTEWTLLLIIDQSVVEWKILVRDIFTEERNIITNLLRKYRRDHLFKWHPCWFPTVSFIVFIRYNNWQSASVSRWSISSLPRRDIQAYSTLVNVSHATGFFWRDRWT